MYRSIDEVVKHCKVKPLILMGGTDINPAIYGAKPLSFSDVPDYNRDVYEENLIDKAIETKQPIIGICRGAQFVCAKAGGSLYQHSIGHNKSHGVFVKSLIDSQVYTLLENVSADHHQVMNPDEVEHTIYGFANHETKIWKSETETELVTMVPEIVYFPKIKGLAIQPHPEWMQHNHIFNQYLTDLVKKLFGE